LRPAFSLATIFTDTLYQEIRLPSGVLTPTAADVSESVLEFPDNFLLIDLCGQFDRNLTAIESALGVQILRRGNRLEVIGGESPRKDALEILKSLYERLESGKTLEPGDIDRELRMHPDMSITNGDQPELFKGELADRVEIKTRKKLVEPRTEAQKA
jgi:phosphate starvation-inducible PhoH-like protein